MTIKTIGVYRVRCEVHGPNGSATVQRVDDLDPMAERYQVHFAPATERQAPFLIAVCWRYEPPQGTISPWMEGGWVRALAIAEDVTQGNATHCYREGRS